MFFKWLFDRLASLIGLVLLSPVILVVAILISFKMPGGPVLFKQVRVGKDGKPFTMVKFRTMTINHGGSSVSVAGENRITPLGASLRKYKLDELPEFWNVLKGDMSFVGPRPDVPGYADQLKGDDREMLALRPGITGPATLKYRDEENLIAAFVANPEAFKLDNCPDFVKMTNEQVALWYNDNIIFPDKVRINRYYLHHYSFATDIVILFATVLGRTIEYGGEMV